VTTSQGGFAAGLVGIVLDNRYRLDAVLGEGGMGAVFRAHHLAMDRRVAIKLLKPHLTTDQAALARFAREARTTLRVDSPHAVKVLDFGVTPAGDYYMALEYLDGRTVQRELDIDGMFEPARVVHIARQSAHALAAAHRIGLVHRDIKPDNILLLRVGDDPDYVKLLDFGVAKLMQGAASSERSRIALTQAGMVFGTPEFMAPEQACGHPLDGRSDIYSLASTMFVMLTGRTMFTAATPIAWLTHQVRTPPPHLAELDPDLARYPELDALIQRCLAKHREQRPATAEELDRALADLEATLRGARGQRKLTTTLQPAVVSASSYIAALPSDAIDPGATLPPPIVDAGHHDANGESHDATTAELVSAARSRSPWWVVAAIVMIAAVGAWLAVGRPHVDDRGPPSAHDAGAIAAVAREPPAPLRPAPALPDAAIAPPPSDASPPLERRRREDQDDRGQRDPEALGEREALAGVPRPGVMRVKNAAHDQHLRNAEDAMRSNNRLRQLAEADLALQADPRSLRARYLLADALIKGGDLERGCAHLRQLGRNQLAIARANAAKCPTD
jgi:serine/threonine protein kinase